MAGVLTPIAVGRAKRQHSLLCVGGANTLETHSVGLTAVLVAPRQIELTPPPAADEPFNMKFHHSFYLATHIVYVQSAYNVIKADQREIPWLYRYIRKSFRFWMRQVRQAERRHVDSRLLREDCTR